MFNDERIIIERGKILRKINIIAIIVSFVFLVSRILIYKDSLGLPVFSLLATEICTLLTSVFMCVVHYYLIFKLLYILLYSLL